MKNLLKEVCSVSYDFFKKCGKEVKKRLDNTIEFYKNNPFDLFITAAGLGITAFTGVNVYIFLNLPAYKKSFLSLPGPEYPMSYYIFQGKKPAGASIFPPKSAKIGKGGRPPLLPLSYSDYLQLVSPFIFFLLTLGIEGIRYYRWKKKVENL